MPAPMPPTGVKHIAKSARGKNDPELPPQLREMENKSVDEVVAELNKCPFFMTEYDDQDGENETLEALKSMAYEGEPHEVATNFKNQGNECYKFKDYRGAIQFYTKALNVKCGVKEIDTALYLNRAQCNLALKNYRRCINDSQNALKNNPKSVKAYFRISKANNLIGKLEDALQAADFGLSFAPGDKDLESLKQQVLEKLEAKKAKEAKIAQLQKTFDDAVAMRGLTAVYTQEGHDKYKKFKLEDVNDAESQFIFGTTVEFPTVEFFSFMEQVGELSSINDIVSIVYASGEPKVTETKNLAYNNISVYIETLSGGLIKAGKKKTINELISLQAPKIPVIDNIVKLYVLPKEKSQDFINSWDKSKRLAIRVSEFELD